MKVRYMAWLCVEALVLPFVLCYLCGVSESAHDR
jgi:hypothetical protein